MYKDFIPYEQALTLKKLGFDEECLACYNTDKHFFFRHERINSDVYERNSLINPEFEVFSAPTISQAFRWFRDNHNLHCEIGCAQNLFFFRIGKVDSFPHILDDNNRRYYVNCYESEIAFLIVTGKQFT